MSVGHGGFLSASKTKDYEKVVSFRAFISWAQNSKWTKFMSEDENISMIAPDQRFAAVFTTPNSLMRLFSLSGWQTEVEA